MEFMPGSDLNRYIKLHKSFTESQAKIIVAEAIIALTSLHDDNIIYRDLKVKLYKANCAINPF